MKIMQNCSYLDAGNHDFHDAILLSAVGVLRWRNPERCLDEQPVFLAPYEEEDSK
jgi:hypothetical protein